MSPLPAELQPSIDKPIEMIPIRNRHSRCYNLGGRRRRFHSSPAALHFQRHDSELWEPVDLSIVSGLMEKADYSFRLLDGKVGYSGMDPEGLPFELELMGVKYKEPVIVGNKAVWENIEKGVDFEITLGTRAIRVVRVLKTSAANREAVYRSYRLPSARGGILNLGKDRNRKPTELSMSDVLTARQNERLFTQVWTGRVKRMDPKTRRREWYDDPVYPVRIDPTSTFDPTAGLDGKARWFYATFSSPQTVQSYCGNSSLYVTIKEFTSTTGALDFKTQGWFVFPITGISKGDTINDATLNLRAQIGDSGTTAYFDCEDLADPAAPTSGERQRIDTNWDPETAASSAHSFTQNASWHDEAVNVKTAIAGMVAAYGYTDANILIRGSNQTDRSVKIAMVDHPDEAAPELVIDYTAGGGATSRRRIVITG